MSKNAKRAITILCVLFFMLFLRYKPYEQFLYGDSFVKEMFVLYSYIINTTLGWVHESGHGVCYLLRCPDFITASLGTVFQLMFPLLLGIFAKKRGSDFGFWIGLFFVGFSMQYTAWYIASAHEGTFLSAEESFLGVDGYHDFHTILSYLGILRYDWLISSIVKVFGYVLMIYSCFKMFICAWVEER